MAAASGDAAPIKILYWPRLIRGAPLVRMLEHTGTEYEYISDKAEMAKYCSTWTKAITGEEPVGDNFAPPVVIDGDIMVSQSIAAALYLGNKLGLSSSVPGWNEYKAMQFCADIVDTFEGGLGSNNESGPALKAFVEGPRCANLMSNVERAIVGPYYFGEEPSTVDFFLLGHLDWRITSVFAPLKEKLGVDGGAIDFDFFLLGHLDWRITSVFAPLKEKLGVDVMAEYPKMSAIYAALTATPGYINYQGGLSPPGPIDDKIFETYNKRSSAEA
eukprot:CAMPEP_0205946360 /NCGR_PEP_ID=MMETSP1325-20131115/68999_1 /ASSEMBLY_ACC=CAM_ASM_000708 /TAXON_ID=236786 /ORGANISM="Florenciella sp., Strain RCC1007" /LENGTH=272 /DNA_ID=CAMNT_0053317423 /DNA_START=75 /DNA_END=894 /DNA_ORIENTATION=-